MRHGKIAKGFSKQTCGWVASPSVGGKKGLIYRVKIAKNVIFWQISIFILSNQIFFKHLSKSKNLGSIDKKLLLCLADFGC